jgi:hypothetical protein
MQLAIRIKASEEYADVQAYAFLGLEPVLKSYPMFVFSSPAQKRSYDEIRRRIKGGESLEAIARSYNVS